MNWYKKAQLNLRKLYFCGDCRGEEWKENIASDATELAQIVESGIEVTKENFYKIAEVDQNTKKRIEMAPKNNYQFYYNEKNHIAWIYNDFEDVEYFYI